MKFTKKSREKAAGGCLFIQIAITLFCLAGWCQCVYKLVNCDFEPSYKAEVIYGIGTFTGLGSIVGWFDLGN